MAPEVSEARQSRRPVRTCIGCRTASERSEVVRLVRSPSGRVAVDHPPRLAGRGAWIHPNPECIGRALRRGSVARAFGGRVVARVDEIVCELRDRLEDRLAGMIACGRGGRHVRVGTEAARDALVRGEARALLFAMDARGDRSALAALAERADVPVATALTKARLGRALGREEVGVVAVTNRTLAIAMAVEHERLGTLDSRLTTHDEATR